MEVRREDRMRMVGSLVERITHEMRNPLNSIRLSLQMLEQRHERGRLRSEHFEMVLEEVDRMNTLVSDLLAFQQPRPPRMQPCAIQPVIERCAELVRAQASRQGVSVSVTGAEVTWLSWTSSMSVKL